MVVVAMVYADEHGRVTTMIRMAKLNLLMMTMLVMIMMAMVML